MSKFKQRLSRRRERLFKEHPYCYWCNCKLVKCCKKNRKRPNIATIDHLRSRLDPSRQMKDYSQNPRTVLSCSKCNENRAKEEVKNLSKEDLWARSKRYPKNRKNNCNNELSRKSSSCRLK